MDLVDDLDVIKSVQAGNSEAFSFLATKYHKHLLNFIYRLMGNGKMVEDLGQEVYLNIYKSIKNFDTTRGVPFSAWLFITARNRCISELRKKAPPAVPLEETIDFPGQEKTPEETAGENERIQAIHEALEQLAEPYKTTILKSLEGHSFEEIALECRISLGTVKSRLFRAREKMRLFLQERFGGNYGQL
jgi:RNA polymerase sigma-70 factor, ECF subfamily